MMKTAAAFLSIVGGGMADNPVIHPAQVVPAGWEMTGENADLKGTMNVLVGLKRSNLDTMQQVFEESSTPGSKGYLNHISWKEMGDLVRPSDSAIGTCTSWRSLHPVTSKSTNKRAQE
jgi:hypothetical protein